MKLVYSLASIDHSGGIERVISTKANYFADILGYEVHIVAAGEQPESLFFSFSDKIRFHYLNIRFSQRKPWDIVFSSINKEYKQKLATKLQEIKPDITISTFGRDAEFLYQLKDGSKKILEFHFTKNYLKHLGEALEGDRLRWLRKHWLRYLLWREEQITKHYQHIVVLTERDKQLWGGGEKFTVIPNPLSFKTNELASLDCKKIVAMGRLVYPKGFQYLIRAFARIAQKFPDWTVEVYGDGHDRQKLQNEINDLSLQAQVTLKEADPAIETILMKAGFFVLPTLYDGFGLVLTEAMACGVPCIAFDCECGPGEIIRNKEDGFLVPVRDIESLTDKMTMLIENKNLRKQMGLKAKENVERFTIEHIGAVWQRYFNSLLGEK